MRYSMSRSTPWPNPQEYQPRSSATRSSKRAGRANGPTTMSHNCLSNQEKTPLSFSLMRILRRRVKDFMRTLWPKRFFWRHGTLSSRQVSSLKQTNASCTLTPARAQRQLKHSLLSGRTCRRVQHKQQRFQSLKTREVYRQSS